MTQVHPRLRAVFDVLTEANVQWAVIRDADALDQPVGEIDLLAARSDMSRMSSVLGDAGFAQLFLLGHGPRAQFVRFDSDSAGWLKLDVVWRIDFGRRHRIRTTLAEGCIARRRQDGPVFVLDPTDQFWLLLLHCVFDKEAVGERHVRSLRRLRPGTLPDSASGELCVSLLGQERIDRLTRAIDGPDPGALEEAGRAVRRQLGSGGVGGRLQFFRSRVARKCAALMRGPLRPGVVVAAIGPSGDPDHGLLREIESHRTDPVFRTTRFVWHRPARSVRAFRPSAWMQRARIWALCRRGWIVLLEGFDAGDLHADRSGLPGRLIVATGDDAPWLGGGTVPTITVDGRAPGSSAVAAIERLRRTDP